MTRDLKPEPEIFPFPHATAPHCTSLRAATMKAIACASPPSPSLNSATGRSHKLPCSPPPEEHHRLAAADRSWLDDSSVQELHHFAESLAGIKAKGVGPELLGSLLAHYASRWLPELSGRAAPSPESPTAAWLKKRFLIETFASVLPPDRAALPCDFLLRLLRAASMVGADSPCLQALEARAAAQLDEASLKELLIPAFSHTSATLLDVSMVLRLVRLFTGAAALVSRTGAALARVAKLVDSYLAEAALDPGLTVPTFEDLATSLPAHARAMDDGLYRAIDTYIKAHPSSSKEERKALCRLVDARKLSSEAALHAAQNERLPVRSVIQVLFAEHSKLSRLAEWSGSFNGSSTGRRSPSEALVGRCSSKREAAAQQQEVRRLKDEVARLHVHCIALQAQVDRLAAAQRKKKAPKKNGWTWSCCFWSGGGSEAVEKKVVRSDRRS